jgi:uncharacterized repeat protein (TIGR01451 family)
MLIVANPGTTPAKAVKVAVSLPKEGGKLVALPTGARFEMANRKLHWSIPTLEPGQVRTLAFEYASSTTGRYQATAEAISGDLRATDTLATEVAGITALDVKLEQTARVMDVGQTNFYVISIKNSGTKEATRLQLSGKLTENLKVLKHYNVEKQEFQFDPETGRFAFPEIERLGVGQTITLSLEVQATEPGEASCQVSLAHAEMGSEKSKVEDVISTAVTGANPPAK